MANERELEKLKEIAHDVAKEILAFKKYGRIIRVHYDESDGRKQGRWSHDYALQSDSSEKEVPFVWNEDDDYCEKHYDAYGVIDDCPLFKEWQEFAERIAAEKASLYGVEIFTELEGVKYQIGLRVKVEKENQAWW